MNTELSSKYDPSAVETAAYQVWLDEKCFHADPSRAGDPYTIVIPPPNVTGALHLGHAINNTLQDILTRAHRMMGFNTLWVPGIDHAGIATQAVVEKQLKEQENKTRHDVGREGLVERIWQWKQQYGDRILSQLQRLGCSCDWDRTRFTLDDMCAKAVRETFFKLFKDGLIYRGKRLVNWDTHLLTTISDDELYRYPIDEPVKTSLWSIKYPIDGTDDFVIVATTRPETMLADTAVAYHSSNAKAAFFKGKQVRLPLTGRLIPLIEDDILVDPTFGTGYVKVTPAHDPNDYAVYQRHLRQPTEIAILNMMTPDGKVNDADASWSAYAGLTFAMARKKIIADLAAGGLHNPETDVKPHEANVKFSDRSKTAIQPYLSDQWFVKMAPLAEPALEVVREEKIKFYPERHAQQYLSWLGEKRDWPVSRQLWWGHRIPVWTFLWNGPVAHAPSDSQEVRMDLPYLSADQNRQIAAQVLRPGSKNDGRIFIGISVRPGNPEVERLIEKHGGEQDPDVLDTWFSSALWPHSTLGWPDMTPELAKYYPTSVLLTGRDIITLWVARMVMMGMYNMGGGTGGPPVSSAVGSASRTDSSAAAKTVRSADPTETENHGRAAHATNATNPSPLYAGERAGVRGGSATGAESGSPLTTGLSSQPSPLGKGEKEPDGGTGGLAVGSASRTDSLPAEKTVRAADPTSGENLTPSPGTPGEGGGGGSSSVPQQKSPHPNPPPAYREREQEARALGLPFLDVAINPTILDGKGERMSKSKGNGVDPVDIIESYGADALRFTLTKMATETQDARMPVKRDANGKNTSEKFDEGRNFCNKLWNACRFALSNLESVGSALADADAQNSPGHRDSDATSTTAPTASAKADPTMLASGGTGGPPVSLAAGQDHHGRAARATLSLVDRWIISRFHRAVKESNDALKAYRFDLYAKTCYDFFWRDFCDWYVEAIKPAMKDPARAPQTANVLSAVLDGSLRLMHPMIPFITETIWWRLNDVRPVRGLPGLLECPPSKRLVLAQWPCDVARAARPWSGSEESHAGERKDTGRAGRAAGAAVRSGDHLLQTPGSDHRHPHHSQ